MTVFDLYDMHCHLAFSPDTRAAAIAMRQEGIGGMCATVTPDEYHLASLALADELNRNSNFKLGVGLHPWWLSDGSCGADAVDKLVALDLMESVGLVAPGAPQGPQNPQSTAVIFHWFSGSGVELARAIECGCYFSINPRMLSTKRGRAYVQQIPEEKLLLESDLPPAAGAEFNAREVRALLEASLEHMAELRRCRLDSLKEKVAANSRALLEG